MKTKRFLVAMTAGRTKQGGATLFIALVFLVMLTVIGLSMFGTTTIEERTARNYRDYNVALQAAEAALRDAEIRITGYWVYKDSATAVPKPISLLSFDSSCTNGLCAYPTQPVYSNYSMMDTPSVALGSCPGGCDGDGNGTGTGSPSLPTSHVAKQPRYLIEIVDWDVPGESASDKVKKQAYRITAIGFGRSSSTQVVLQEIFLSY